MHRILLSATILTNICLSAQAAPPLCALLSTKPPITLVAAPGEAQPPQAAPSPAAPQVVPSVPAAAVSRALTNLPFLQHVEASGAKLVDLGESHGLHRVAAQTGDQFMIFEVLPDGSAAVSGPSVELSPAEIAKVAGSGVTDLGTSHGFKGYFVRSGAHFQVFYATPDGQQLIPGILYDAAGKDVTRQQVASIPGAVPTVEVTDGKGTTSVSALPLVQKTAFGVVGKDSAPRIYMLIDPQCIYSIRALQMLKPFVDAGRVQLAVVPLSVLDYEDNGASTRAALAASMACRRACPICSRAWEAEPWKNRYPSHPPALLPSSPRAGGAFLGKRSVAHDGCSAAVPTGRA
jgi:thiol:disulfide interchange protein DsbG